MTRVVQDGLKVFAHAAERLRAHVEHLVDVGGIARHGGVDGVAQILYVEQLILVVALPDQRKPAARVRPIVENRPNPQPLRSDEGFRPEYRHAHALRPERLAFLLRQDFGFRVRADDLNGAGFRRAGRLRSVHGRR